MDEEDKVTSNEIQQTNVQNKTQENPEEIIQDLIEADNPINQQVNQQESSNNNNNNNNSTEEQPINQANAQDNTIKVIPKKKYFSDFIFLGIDTTKSEEPTVSIIALFPPKSKITKGEMDMAIKYCFPKGCQKIDNIPNDTNILTGFVFRFPQMQNSYFTVLHIYIPENIKTFIGDNFDHSYPFCLCLVSQNPCITDHFTFLSKISDIILGKIQVEDKCPEIPDKLINFEDNLLPSLFLHEECPYIAVSEKTEVPEFLLPELIEYYNRKFYPSLTPSYYLLYPTLSTLLSIFDVKKLVQIFTYILVSAHIICTSEDPCKLSFCILAILNSMDKFKFSELLNNLLILPLSDSDLLEAPVGFIFGYPKNIEYHPNADCIINFDTGEIKELYKIASYPNSKDLVKKIKSLLSLYLPKFVIPKKTKSLFFHKPNPQYQEFLNSADKRIYQNCFQYFVPTKYIFDYKFIRKFVKVLNSEFVNLFMFFIKKHLETDTTNPNDPIITFNDKLFLNRLLASNILFFKSLLESQVITNFIDNYTYNKKPEEMERLKIQTTKERLSKIKKEISHKRRLTYPVIMKKDDTPFKFD